MLNVTYAFDLQRAMSELEIVVDMSKDDPNVTDMDLETGEEGAGNNSKESKGEETKEVEAQNEESAENNESEDVKESSAQLNGGQDGGEQLVDVSNNEGISLTNRAEHEVTLEEGDFDREGDPVSSESRDRETGESWIEDGVEEAKEVEEEEKPIKEEENPEEGGQGGDEEGQGKEEGEREEETSVKYEAENEENQATEEAIQQEDMEVEGSTLVEEKEGIKEEEDREEEEGPAVEEDEEEGSGRFVEIDDEQFEVIDDMDEEDSDEDDYKKVTVPSCVDENDKVNEQLATESSINKPDNRIQKTGDSEDDYKEVTTTPLTTMTEDNDQAKDQFPADSSYYDYAAQYQAWLSTAAARYTTMDYGPSQVRISGEELVLAGIICSYLQLCPSGATSGEIRDYLSRQFKERRKEVVERLLYSLPVLFKADDASGNAKWKFCGFENLAEFKSAET